MAYFFPSPDESDSKVFLRLDEKKEHNMIIGQSDQPECDICKTKLWDWIYSGIPAKQTEKRERYLVLFNQYCSVLIKAPQKGRILSSFAYTAFFLKRKRAFRFFVSEMMIKTTKVGSLSALYARDEDDQNNQVLLTKDEDDQNNQVLLFECYVCRAGFLRL